MKQEDSRMHRPAGRPVTVTIEIDVESEDTSPEDFAEQMQERIEDFMKSGAATTADQEISWTATACANRGTLAHLARLDTWEERCIAEAIDGYGMTDPDEIREHIHSAQTDLDYLAGQDETLEGMIGSARTELGQESGTIEGALRDRGIEPKDAEDNPEP